jgi:hypothetical protein
VQRGGCRGQHRVDRLAPGQFRGHWGGVFQEGCAAAGVGGNEAWGGGDKRYWHSR